MMVLVVYDICVESKDGAARLRKAAKQCLAWGRRVQNSVYECEIDADQYRALKQKLERLISPDTDSVRFYRLGNHFESRIESIGLASQPVSYVL